MGFFHVTKAKEGSIFTLLDGIIRRSKTFIQVPKAIIRRIVGEWSATISPRNGRKGGRKGEEPDS